MHVLTSILGFLLAVGLLVAVHEWGHFWVARKLGVKVLRFSLGFGRPLRVWRRGETEYVLAALPLGGYVKMLDGREGPLDPAEAHRAFDRQSLGRRSAIVAAGPVANLIFAVLAYALMYMVGVSGLAPIVDQPAVNTPAALAGVVREAQVLAVNEKPIRTFDDLRVSIIEAAASDEEISLRVRQDGDERVLVLPGAPYRLLDSVKDPLVLLGLRPWLPDAPRVVRRVVAGGAGAAAGLRPDDVILRANGASVERGQALVEVIRNHPGQRIALDLIRGGKAEQVMLTPASRAEDGDVIGYAGVAFGLDIDPAVRERLQVLQQDDPARALLHGVLKTWDMTVLSLRVMGKMIVGEASLEAISGPLGIADVAGRSLALGLSSFLAFLALVSLSLAILNLLPVPVLDGGHLLFYLIEALRGQPLSEQAQMLGQRIGMSLLFALMALAMFNDLSRLIS